jgi:hypothetical protein
LHLLWAKAQERMSLEFDLSRAAMREGMVDVYVSLGQLKRRVSAPGSRAPAVDRAPLTGAALVNAFMQINPARVKAATP